MTDPFTGAPMARPVAELFTRDEIAGYLQQMGVVPTPTAVDPNPPVQVTPQPDLSGPPIDVPIELGTREWVPMRATMDLDLWFRRESVEGNSRDDIYAKIHAALGGQSGWWLPNLTYQIRDLRRVDMYAEERARVQAQQVASHGSPGPTDPGAFPAAPATGRPGSMGHPDEQQHPGFAGGQAGASRPSGAISNDHPGREEAGLGGADGGAHQANPFAAFVDALRLQAIDDLGVYVSPEDVIEYLAQRASGAGQSPVAAKPGLQLDRTGRHPEFLPGDQQADDHFDQPRTGEPARAPTVAPGSARGRRASDDGRQEDQSDEHPADRVHRDEPVKPARRRSSRAGQSTGRQKRKANNASIETIVDATEAEMAEAIRSLTDD